MIKTDTNTVAKPATTTWNARLYDDKHAFVFKYGEDLVDVLAPAPGEKILDLGCGTGYLTGLIAEKGALVTGVDSSAEMIAKAKTTYPALDFAAMSATDLQVRPGSFDAVFSNAVLHWVLDKEGAIDNIYACLRPGGRLVLEMGGKDNVQAIVENTRKALVRHGYADNAAEQLWYFPSLGEYATLLEKRGFRVSFATHYDRETPLQDNEKGIMDWIRMFGNAFFRNIPETAIPGLLEEIQESVRPTNYRNNTWYGDYKRLRVVAIK